MTTGQQHEDLLERARNVIRDLKAKLAAAEARTAPDPIAVIGMAGRFPGAGEDLGAFWKMIAEGRDAVRDIPPERWDSDAFYHAKAPAPGKTNIRRAALLDEVARFDASFFDVTPVEAIRMDPQQRIFLETAWHALEDAGMTRALLRGSDAGVFVGVHGHSADYGAMQFDDPATMVIDTACSSSLVAVHLACRSLRAGDCSLAVVGGTNLILSPRTSVAMSQLQMLADDGRSKTFDSRADGFGRGEGCGVVVLKRLSDALRDQDRILAVIRGSAINQDGRTNGLTAPSGLAQQRLLQRALKEAGISPSQVGYFEAHGTGTALGDPIEVEAIAEVVGKEERSTPCVLGSVKANIGHLEGAAGIAGLIKIVLVMRHGYFPPVAHLEDLNPHLALNGSGLTIPMGGSEWPRQGRRFSSVSSFGWSGTNAHVVLEEAPEQPPKTEPSLPVLIAISAATPDSLGDLAEAYATRIEEANGTELAAIGYTSTIRRTHHRYRLAVSGSDGLSIASKLRERLRERASSLGKAIDPQEKAAKTPSGAHGLSDAQRRLEEIALTWEQGGEIDWAELYPRGGNVVSLPQYPFGGRSYWLPETVASVPSRPTSGERKRGSVNLDEQQKPCATAPGATGDAVPVGATPPAAPEDHREVPALVSQLQKLSSRDRYEQLLSFVTGETRLLFGMPPDEPVDEHRGLIEMGMDSLMTVMLQNELQSQLGVQLSATLVLDYPNLASLARFLDGKLFAAPADLLGQSAAATAVANGRDGKDDDEDLNAIAMLSDAEMDAALEAELAAIRKLGVQ
jgi:acyl transferase domain-containing protein/acyl carrier protein